ncbi:MULTISPECIES: hypothetical protein [Arenibacter]|uniref:hypothetical protein n=1 Tax=Arenibacter TaxID=178469 RepID=UPI0004DF5ABD|nr:MULTISPECIES: hypothetical protein [Arenibacter]MDX1766466.1 hypothetical protein [Arenibacter troitsensis]GBF22242.1 hypothetical protein C21_04436 [Arenibacter sp. NBRC 103722]
MDDKIVWIINDDMVSQFAMEYKIGQSWPTYKVIGFYAVLEALTQINQCLETKLTCEHNIIGPRIAR